MVKKNKTEWNKDVEITQEVKAIENCLAEISALKNYKAEMRVVNYITQKVKSESHRQYEEKSYD
jgi:hypothetical protein